MTVKGLYATRHSVSVKVILCLPLFFASLALADDAGDRTAIGRVIAGLNEWPLRAALFTSDSDGESALRRLPKVALVGVRMLGTGGPTVRISHEPWGEATIDFPGLPAVVESVNPRIVSGTIRFIASDVAVADGAWTYLDNGGATQNIPLVLVMKKEGDTWKIAALRWTGRRPILQVVK